jgi:hypothetical protein
MPLSQRGAGRMGRGDYVITATYVNHSGVRAAWGEDIFLVWGEAWGEDATTCVDHSGMGEERGREHFLNQRRKVIAAARAAAGRPVMLDYFQEYPCQQVGPNPAILLNFLARQGREIQTLQLL